MSSKATLRDAARILDRDHRNIISRWAQRMVKTEAVRSRQDLHLQDVLGAVPLLVTALAAWLRKGDFDEPLQPPEDLRLKARAHAEIRVEHGFELGDVMADFQLLRGEIWRAVCVELYEMHSNSGDILFLGQQLNYALDGVLAATAEACCELGKQKGKAGW